MKPTQLIKTSLLAFALVGGIAATVLADKNHEKEKDHAVAWKDVPAAVQTTIASEAKGGTVIEVEKSSKKGKDVFEAKVKGTDGKTTEIKVAADGKLLKVGVETEDEDDEKD